MSLLDAFAIGLIVGTVVGIFVEYWVLWGKYIKHHTVIAKEERKQP